MIEPRREALPPSLAADDILMAALNHWVGVYNGTALPSAELIDPLMLPRRMLPHVALTDFIGDRIYYRLVGTIICERWGEDFTGRFVDEIMSGEYAEWASSSFHRCRAAGLPLFTESRFRWDVGRGLWTRRLMLPYLRRPEQSIRVMLVQTFDGDGSRSTQPLRSLLAADWLYHAEPIVLMCVKGPDVEPTAHSQGRSQGDTA